MSSDNWLLISHNPFGFHWKKLILAAPPRQDYMSIWPLDLPMLPLAWFSLFSPTTQSVNVSGLNFRARLLSWGMTWLRYDPLMIISMRRRRDCSRETAGGAGQGRPSPKPSLPYAPCCFLLFGRRHFIPGVPVTWANFRRGHLFGTDSIVRWTASDRIGN